MRKDTSGMNKVSGFETLYIKQYKGKFYIYSPAWEASIGPSFTSIDALNDYAKEKYYDDYV